MTSYKDLAARLQILQVKTKRMPLDVDVDLSTIAQRTERYTGAGNDIIPHHNITSHITHHIITS